MRTSHILGLASAVALVPGLAHSLGRAHNCQQEHADTGDTATLRAVADAVRTHHREKRKGECDLATMRGCAEVQILGFNDFHGRLSTDQRVGGRLTGGAAVLASYLRDAARGKERKTIIAVAGDHVGATPLNSALLQDEPAISFLNLLANDHCRHLHTGKTGEPGREGASPFQRWFHPRCNLVASLGNHEFDEGRAELLRLLGGGNFAGGPFGAGPFLEDPWRGARYPVLAANVIDVATGVPLVPPYVVKEFDGVRVGFIGAVLKETPTIVTPAGVAGLEFLDEADAANRYAAELEKAGVRALVLVIHQGQFQTSSANPTDPAVALPDGAITRIVNRLDPEFDVVVSGHSHTFTNALVPTSDPSRPALVTQAFANSTAFADIDLVLDRKSGDVVSKTARVVTTFAECPLPPASGQPAPPCPAEVAPGLPENVAANAPDVLALVEAANGHPNVVSIANRVVARLSVPILRDGDGRSAALESQLGDLIADAQRAAMQTDMAFMNPGGIRQNLVPAADGTVLYRQIFDVQPFGNSLVKMELTGAQIRHLLDQQFSPPNNQLRVLQISGLRYGYRFLSGSSGPGEALGIFRVNADGSSTRLDEAASYTVTVNSFIADGGDNFAALREGTSRVGGPIDLDALEAYLAPSTAPGGVPVAPPALGRITLCTAANADADVCTE